MVNLSIHELVGMLHRVHNMPLEAPFTMAVALMVRTHNTGNKSLWFGNGGSASLADHVVGELVGRFRINERPPLAALSLTCPSVITALANDYGYENIYSRQVTALGGEGDVAVGLSTSGRSPNVIKALQEARELGMVTVAFIGPPSMADEWLMYRCSCVVAADLSVTELVQEQHMKWAHVLCGLVEAVLFGSGSQT